MKITWIAIVSLWYCANAVAYDPVTHVKASDIAAKASLLADKSLLSRLGLQPQPIDSDIYNAFYSSESSQLSILELIKFGAKWEDTRRTSQGKYHFFNPLSGKGKTVLGAEIGPPSPSWALDESAQFFDQPFSYFKARRYFLSALTMSEKSDRNGNWGLTFQTLGHIIHHIQDMAQPQHTRDDAHCDILTCAVTGFFGYSKFNIEEWTRENAPDLFFQGYAPVYSKDDIQTFSAPRKFWITSASNTGLGIAEYSNRGFFSAGTNVGSGFPLPTIDPTAGTKVDIQAACATALTSTPCPQGLTGKVTFFATNVIDSYRPAQSGVNSRATTYSIFDSDLKGRSILPKYSVNRFTFDAANSFLLQRAVGYSAGMINYFFRGDLDLKRPAFSPAQFAIKNKGPDNMFGTFRLFYDAADGRRQLVPGAEWNNLSIDAGQESAPFDIDLNVSPPPALSNTFILVFNGKMGAETDGVAVSVVNAKPPVEGLYVLATDMNGARVVLRTNKQGTQVVPPTEFEPFRSDVVTPGYGRKYIQKQFAFGPPGALREHKFLSLTSVNGLRRTTFVDADGNISSSNANSTAGDVRWVSTPDTNGTADFYLFTLDATGILRWSRKHVGGGTPPSPQGGTVVLPATFMGKQINYSDANLLSAVVSPDGLTFYGISAPGDSDGIGYRDQRNLKLQITISGNVSAALQLDRQFTFAVPTGADTRTEVDAGAITAMGCDENHNTVPVSSIRGQTTNSFPQRTSPSISLRRTPSGAPASNKMP